MTMKETLKENIISINPITRLEGHGKISIHLNEEGTVNAAYFQVPELRGFEKFVEGLPAEEMPRVTQRICGVCPTAHHMAATRALDDLWKVEPTPAAHVIREFVYNCFMVEDHCLHFFFLGGPDFVVGPDAPKAERNVLGVIQAAGIDAGKKVIAMRKEIRNLMTEITGKVVHPVFGVPGGVTKALNKDIQERALQIADRAIEFAQWTMGLFNSIVLGNKDYVALVLNQDLYYNETYYMGLVDKNNQSNYYRGDIRVVDPSGKEYAKFDVHDYTKYVAEHVEPWTYVRQTYLKPLGWKGFVDGPDSGMYRVNPLARLNVSEGLSTPLAQVEYDRLYETLGGKPVHHTLAWHWARLVEMLHAAEKMKELASMDEFIDSNVRVLPDKLPPAESRGIGVVEAPRGTLFHDYITDENAIVKKANLIVATQQNAAPINMGIGKVAKALFNGSSPVSDGLLNKVEMAFRAYDPCFACATHTLPGQLPLDFEVRRADGSIQEKVNMATFSSIDERIEKEEK